MSLYDLLPSFQISPDPSPADIADGPPTAPTPSRQLKRLSLAPGRLAISPNVAPGHVRIQADDTKSGGTVVREEDAPDSFTTGCAAQGRSIKGYSDSSISKSGIEESLDETPSDISLAQQRQRSQKFTQRARRWPASVVDSTTDMAADMAASDHNGGSGMSLLQMAPHGLRPRPTTLANPTKFSLSEASGMNGFATSTVIVPFSTPYPHTNGQRRSEEARRGSSGHPLTLAEKHGELLRNIARKESMVNDARQALQQEEQDLEELKARWAIVLSRSNAHSTTTSPLPGSQLGPPPHTKSSSTNPTSTHHRPQPANAARLTRSPSENPMNAHPLTRTSSSTSGGSSHGLDVNSPLRSLHMASNTASTLVSQGLANLGMGDLSQFTSGAASGRVVEGGRRFVGHFLDALQGVAEGVVSGSPGQAVDLEFAEAEQRGRVGIRQDIRPGSPQDQRMAGSMSSIPGSEANRSTGVNGGSSSLRSLTAGSPIVGETLGRMPQNPNPVLGKRNIKHLSLVSTSTERAMDTAISENLVDLVGGEDMSAKLEGLGFVPLSPKKASPRRARPGSPDRQSQANEAGRSPRTPSRRSTWLRRGSDDMREARLKARLAQGPDSFPQDVRTDRATSVDLANTVKSPFTVPPAPDS